MGSVPRHNDTFAAKEEDAWTTSNMEYGNFYIGDRCCGWRIDGSSVHNGQQQKNQDGKEGGSEDRRSRRSGHKMCVDCRREWDALREELRRCKAQLEEHVATCRCANRPQRPVDVDLQRNGSHQEDGAASPPRSPYLQNHEIAEDVVPIIPPPPPAPPRHGARPSSTKPPTTTNSSSPTLPLPTRPG